MSDPVAHRALAALDRLAGQTGAVGVAVSGGGDSVALLHLMQGWAATSGRSIRAATVNHHLRPEALDEARATGRMAAALGIPHDILDWHAGDVGGNLMARARDGRSAMLEAWATHHRIKTIALGHTRDDVAETLLMRLARGAGVDGLAMMDDRRTGAGVSFIRPMLDIGRDELRDWLRARGIAWIDDPTNDNPHYERARIRASIRELGLDARNLAQTAANMAMARDALNHAAHTIAHDATARLGTLHLNRARFDGAPAEIRRRLIVSAITWVNGAPYPPRRDSILRLMGLIADGRQGTLDGVVIRPNGAQLTFLREAAACTGFANGIWDRRWRLTLPKGARVAATGTAALSALNWREAGLTHAEAAATPAVTLTDGTRVFPAISATKSVTVTALRGIDAFLASLSH